VAAQQEGQVFVEVAEVAFFVLVVGLVLDLQYHLAGVQLFAVEAGYRTYQNFVCALDFVEFIQLEFGFP